MNFDKISTDLVNKNILAVLDERSDSFKKFGPKLTGKLVGRSKECQSEFKNRIISLTILTHEYLTYQIPCTDIKVISEFF
jgi:hypothetical protein